MESILNVRRNLRGRGEGGNWGGLWGYLLNSLLWASLKRCFGFGFVMKGDSLRGTSMSWNIGSGGGFVISLSACFTCVNSS